MLFACWLRQLRASGRQTMEYEQAVSRIRRLSQITKNKDIYGDCAAIAGGVFCPAHGIALAAPYIRDAAILIVGMAECAWYAKNSGEYYTFHKASDRFYCSVLEDTDVTFGFGDTLVEQIGQVARETNCACVIVASTCIPEIIGEDLEAAAEAAQERIGIPVLLIHTSHFDERCYEYEIAVERLLLALGQLMKPQKKEPKTINLIGLELHGFGRTASRENELTRLLALHGIRRNVTLLGDCTTGEIARAGTAQLNVVTHRVGIPLAKRMQEQLSVPWVYFPVTLEMRELDEAYCRIEEALGISIPQRSLLRQGALETIDSAREVCRGKRVVNGGRPPDAIETTAFLVSLGLEPILINAARLYPTTSGAIEAIRAAGYDPLVNYVANQHITAAIVERDAPDLYIGHGNAAFLQRLHCPKLESVLSENLFGYEAIREAADRIRLSLQAAETGGGEK